MYRVFVGQNPLAARMSFSSCYRSKCRLAALVRPETGQLLAVSSEVFVSCRCFHAVGTQGQMLLRIEGLGVVGTASV